jgi:DNA polymerase-1
LWEGYDTTPKCTINWDSPAQVTTFFKELGFNTSVQDKKTGEDKDSVLEKVLKGQKGINDEFLDIYFDYKEHSKVCSTYGQGQLNMINPKTGRIHTTFKQLGAASGRLSCGSKNPNTDLAKANKVAPKECTYCNLQQLPADEPTRSSFVAPKGYKFVSADFSAEESRLGADIYQDKEFLREFTEGSKDTHNMFAWIVYNDECKKLGCKDATEVKKKAPQWRKKVKGFEFGYMFGAAAPTLAATAGCTVEEAQAVVDKLDKAFAGMTAFARKGAAFVRSHGYIIINPQTGHRLNWWDWETWKERQKMFNQPGFWEDFKAHHKGTGDAVALEVRHHFQAASKYDRLARNVVTQGTGAIILKDAMTTLFNWIVDNGYFNIIHICVAVHDEINCDYPKEVENFPNVLESIMESSAAKYCKSLPIPAEASVSDHWIH